MANRPNWKIILFWTRRPIYAAVIFTAVLAIILFLDSYLLLWNGLITSNLEILKLLFSVAWGLALIPGILWNLLKWVTTGYSMTEIQFVFSKGVFNRKKYMVGYEKIQNINVDRSLLERLLGLSTIRIETAGARPWESELELEGVSSGTAEALVKEISRMAEEAKAREQGKVQVNVSALPQGQGPNSEVLELREQVKKLSSDLKELRDSLAKEKKKKIWEK